MSRDKFVERAIRNLGVTHGSTYHKQIVDGYNRVHPRPVGYKATYQDDWCAVFVTWCADKEGVADLTGRECGVQRWKKIFENKGIWKGRIRPAKGDIIVYDWQGFHANWADHIGIVETVKGNTVTTIEGNTGSPRQVKRRNIAWNHNSIVGYARPKWKGVSTVKSTKSTKSTSSSSKKTLHLPKTAEFWRIYKPEGPYLANGKGQIPNRLRPAKYGGLKYEIKGNPMKDVYLIDTRDFGRVAIYAHPETGAVIK